MANVKLETVYPRSDANKLLYEILDAAVVDGDSDGIEIGELGTLNTGNISLGSVLPYDSSNELLYKVLLESNGDYDYNSSNIENKVKSLTVGDISFDPSSVRLETVIGSTDNEILKALCDKGVKVGEIGTAINSLSLYEIYGANCFTKDVAEAADPETRPRAAGEGTRQARAS